ncbi:hypothetical protein LTS17_011321 [Exophiala oligosperma]
MAAPIRVLFRGGTVLTHDDDDHVIPIESDLLVEGKSIKEISPSIQLPTGSDVKVVDCKNKIVSPGFISTHQHLWQSLCKSLWSEFTILEYLCLGLFDNVHHQPNDIFWAELAGALEGIDAGTTTVMDHAHFHYSTEHSDAAIAALEATGLRAVFCFCPSSRLRKHDPLEVDGDIFCDWIMDKIQALAQNAPYGDGRIQIGFGLDEFRFDRATTVDVFKRIKSFGIKHVTTHYFRSPAGAKNSRLALFDEYGIVDPDTHWVVSHATNPMPGDASLLQKHNMYISSAPSSAMQMVMGHPTALYHPTEDFFSHASVGADSHAICGSSLASELRILLQDARAQFNDSLVESWKSPAKLNRSVEDAFNLATVKGARALGMADQIGQLKAGMAADIVVYDGTTPAMYGGAQTNPVTAIVTLSSPADVELVMVDGIIRKERGRLKNVQTAQGDQKWREGANETLTWAEISAKLIEKSRVMKSRIHSVDENQMRKSVMQFLNVDPSVVVE